MTRTDLRAHITQCLLRPLKLGTAPGINRGLVVFWCNFLSASLKCVLFAGLELLQDSTSCVLNVSSKVLTVIKDPINAGLGLLWCSLLSFLGLQLDGKNRNRGPPIRPLAPPPHPEACAIVPEAEKKLVLCMTSLSTHTQIHRTTSTSHRTAPSIQLPTRLAAFAPVLSQLDPSPLSTHRRPSSIFFPFPRLLLTPPSPNQPAK